MPLVPRLTGANLALVAVFAALIAALTWPPEFPLASGIPITLQTLGVVLAGLVLGAWRGAAAVALYAVAGLAGLPIYANGGTGWAVFTGPTGGYLWSFPLAAFIVGWIAERVRARATGVVPFAALLGAGVASMPVIYAIGVPWLAHALQVPVFNPATEGGGTAIAWGLTPFVVGDLLKIGLAAAVAAAVHRAFPQILGSGRGMVDGTVPERAKVSAGRE